MTPESISAIGGLISNMSRWLQRTYPYVNCRGSQCGEDEVIAKYFSGQDPVCYVDVGASWPIECSNTWGLYNRGGRGLLIEPLPHCWQAILRSRAGDYLCPVASSDVDGYARMRVCASVSSLRPDWPIEEQGSILVETEKLSTTLARYPSVRDKCRFCSIDVEGHEKEVLMGIDWATFHPDMFVIEYRRYVARGTGEDTSSDWSSILTSNGYALHHSTDLNQIWTKK